MLTPNTARKRRNHVSRSSIEGRKKKLGDSSKVGDTTKKGLNLWVKTLMNSAPYEEKTKRPLVVSSSGNLQRREGNCRFR